MVGMALEHAILVSLSELQSEQEQADEGSKNQEPEQRRHSLVPPNPLDLTLQQTRGSGPDRLSLLPAGQILG